MSKVTFKRLYQHGGDTFSPGVEYDLKNVPEILHGFAKPVKVKEAPVKKKSSGKAKK